MGVEGDEGARRDPAYLGDDGLGGRDRHRGDVHDLRPAHGLGDVLGARGDLGRAGDRGAIHPVTPAVRLVDHPVADGGPRHVDDEPGLDPGLLHRLERVAGEVLAAPGDHRRDGAARGGGRGTVHAVAAEGPHQRRAVPQDDVVDGEVPHDDHVGVGRRGEVVGHGS